MFRPEDVQARLREQPFRPLRFTVSEGRQYDIVHPDLVMVGTRDVMIGFPSQENPHVYDRVIRVALVHLVGMEELPTPTPASSNGSAE